MRSVHVDIGINGAFLTRRWEEPENWMRLTAELGQSWAVMDGYSKLHACCQYAHAAVDAVLAATSDMNEPDEIDEINVATHRLALPMTNAAPATTLAGKFSLPHIVATTIVHRHADVAAFAAGTLNEPRVEAIL